MPFAKYKDHADCVAKNQDKRNPDAYCAFVERKVIGKEALAKKAAMGHRRLSGSAGKRRKGNPRTDEERAMRHRRLHGTSNLPPRGSGLKS